MKKRTMIAGVSVLLGCILVICVALMFAKYKMNFGEQSEITSKNFYFSSNFLKSDEIPTYEIYGNTVTFELRNFVDSLRRQETNILYNVTATANGLDISDCLDISGGTLEGGADNFQSVRLTYAFENEDQKEITVTATGTGDFTQTLQATFILNNPVGLSYEIKDEAGRDYAELYLYMGNTAQEVTLEWDNGNVVIDETNDYVFGEIQHQTSPKKSSVPIDHIAADTTVKIVFFKKVITDNYTCGITKPEGTTITLF